MGIRHASSTGKRDGSLNLLTAFGVRRGATVRADKGYDTQDFVAALITRRIVPLIARNTVNGRRIAMPRTVPRRCGYGISQKVRKWVEQNLGWIKTIGALSEPPMDGIATVRGWET